jgi:hypothetical protein
VTVERAGNGTDPAGRAIAAAALSSAAGLLAGCGSSPSPSARPTVTVTVSAPALSAPAISPAPSAQSPTTASALGRATNELTASLGSGNGAAGSIYYPIEFTDSSGSACTLYGYPGVSFVTAGGAQVSAPGTEAPTYPRRLVTLAPGNTAHAELKITDALNYPAGTCHPVAVHRLKVFPPGQTAALYITLPAAACRNAAIQILEVQTIQPGNGD